jgi:hypothetical protein
MSITHHEWVTVSDDLPADLKALCLLVLKGDDSAVRPLLDCALENTKSKESVTVNYVHMLEDTLRDWKTRLKLGTAIEIHVQGMGTYHSVPSTDLYRQYFTLERHARQLNRQGLS